MHNNIMAAGSMGSSSQCLHRGIMPQWRHSFFTINDTRKTNGWDALKEIAILEVTYITSMSLFKILPAKEQEFLTIVPEPNNNKMQVQVQFLFDMLHPEMVRRRTRKCRKIMALIGKVLQETIQYLITTTFRTSSNTPVNNKMWIVLQVKRKDNQSRTGLDSEDNVLWLGLRDNVGGCFEDLKYQYDNLRIELNKSEFDLANYKRGLASMKEQLVFYKKNKGMLCDQIDVLKRDASFNESEINAFKIQIERLKKEKESNQFKIDNFKNASKSLDKLIGSQISNNNIKGVGYNVVPPPPTGLFAPPTIDLSNSGLEKFKQPEFEGYGVKVNKSVSENSSKEIKKTYGDPIIEDWVSECNEDETLEKVSESANFTPKACFVCGSFNHLIKDCDFHDKKMVQKPVLNNVKKGTGQKEVKPVWNNAMRTNHQNFSNSKRIFAPTVVLTKSGLVPISTARQSSSRAAASVSTVRPIKTAAPKPFVNVAKTRPNTFQKSHSPSRRSFYQQIALKNRNLNNKVNNTAKGKRVTSVVGEQGIDAVKSKACWVWRPKLKVGDEVVHKELGDRMERAATTASSFKAEQDSGGYTLGSDEDSKKLNELTELCTKQSKKDEDGDLVLKDPSKQGRMSKVEYEDVEAEHTEEVEYGDILEQIPQEFQKLHQKKKFRDVTVAYQSFEDMLKGFDREDLVALWSLVKERFRSAEPTIDMQTIPN
ncbi:hypothetical protein Tco_1485795 [Tanacetum coccineum]